MSILPKCLLLPIDGSQDALRPATFLAQLYPDRSQVRIILCYFAPGIPPVYHDRIESPQMAKKKQDILRTRDKETQTILGEAKEKLQKAGFHTIEAYVQEKPPSTAKDTCRLADLKKVDAVVLHKRITSALESFLKGDILHTVLDHCLVSPVWLIEGNTSAHSAAICLDKEEASLRAADHAAFMLSGTSSKITLLHVAQNLSNPVSCSASHISAEMEKWLMIPEGRAMRPFLFNALDILKREGIPEERIQMSVIPGRGRVATEILAHCRASDIGIVILGHSPPSGLKGLLKGSVTKKIVSEIKNMSVWINQ